MARIIVENDFSGDPDGLFQLAQPVIFPSIDIAMFVGSHLPATSPFVRSQTTATDAVEKVNELLALMGKLVCTGD